MYKFYNKNPLNKFEDDCVIRAISCATNKSWDYVYDYLSDIAQYEGTLLDKKEFVTNYLDKTYQRLKNIKGSVGYVSSLFPYNTLIIAAKSHLVCSKQGVIYDTFDSRNYEVDKIWLIN
jgi:hypothetical protein